VDTITLPDSTAYHFLYEAKGTGQPYTAGGTGPVTGRIAQVTLPTGGTIVYDYGTSNSMMKDGSPAVLNRTLGGGTYKYSRAVQSGQALPQTTTKVLDPPVSPYPANETDLNFQEFTRLSETPIKTMVPRRPYLKIS